MKLFTATFSVEDPTVLLYMTLARARALLRAGSYGKRKINKRNKRTPVLVNLFFTVPKCKPKICQKQPYKTGKFLLTFKA